MSKLYWIQRTLGDIESGWVLDVGTGYGRFIEDLRFALAFRGCSQADEVKIVGVDISRIIETARRDSKHNYYIAMNAVRLGFPHNCFDVVCLVRALHHMTDAVQVQALAEMYRVLKPNGRFFVAEMYRDNQSETQMTDVLLHHWVAAVETAARRPNARWVHRETFTRDEIVAIVQGIGLRELQLYDVAFPIQEQEALDPSWIKFRETELNHYIAQYLEGPKSVPGSEVFRARGEELRQRLHAIGWTSATLLVAVGIK